MKRRIKFLYFMCFIQKEVNKDNWKSIEYFSFDKWMHVFEKHYQQRQSIDIGSTKVRVENVVFNNESKVWNIHFMKLREDNMPSVAKENIEAHPIDLSEDEYLGEDLFILYDEKACVAMVQVNRFSLGTIRLEEFLTHIWSLPGQRVKLLPIMDKYNESFFKSKSSYRKLEISVVNINNKATDNHSSLSQIKNNFSRIGAPNGSITFTMGQRKTGSLNMGIINELITEAVTDDEISGLKLHYKDDDSRPVEVIDLLDKVYSTTINYDIPERGALSFGSAFLKMEAEYKKLKPKIVSLAN